MSHLQSIQNINELSIPLDRDIFLTNLIRELAGKLKKSSVSMRFPAL
jgi:hypothetical protein